MPAADRPGWPTRSVALAGLNVIRPKPRMPQVNRAQFRMQSCFFPRPLGTESEVMAPLDKAAGEAAEMLPCTLSAGKRAPGNSEDLPARKRPCLESISANARMLQRESCIEELAAAGCRQSRERGYMGVRWSRKKNKWRVRIKANGKVSPPRGTKSFAFPGCQDHLHDFPHPSLPRFHPSLTPLLLSSEPFRTSTSAFTRKQ